MQHVQTDGGLGVSLNQGRGGFKDNVNALTNQIIDVARGMPRDVAQSIAGVVQGIMRNPKGVFTAAIAGATVAQASGVTLVQMFEPTQVAPGTASLVQDADNWGLGYRIVAREFTNNGSVAVKPTQLRMYGFMEDAFGDEHDPRLQTNNSWVVTFHPIINGQLQHPSVLHGKERFGNGGFPQIDIDTTNLTNSRGRAVYEFTVDLSGSQIQFDPGWRGLVSFSSETTRMQGGAGRPGLFAVNTYTGLNGPDVSKIGWTIQNGGQFYNSSHQGNGMISSLELTGQPVPEPATLLALGAGAALVINRRRRSP